MEDDDAYQKLKNQYLNEKLQIQDSKSDELEQYEAMKNQYMSQKGKQSEPGHWIEYQKLKQQYIKQKDDTKINDQ